MHYAKKPVVIFCFQILSLMILATKKMSTCNPQKACRNYVLAHLPALEVLIVTGRICPGTTALESFLNLGKFADRFGGESRGCPRLSITSCHCSFKSSPNSIV